MAGLTALLLAGRRPGIDPLAAAEGVTLKALIPIAGEAMVSRVARTLLALPEIDRLIALTQDIDPIAAALPADPRLSVERSGDGIARSVAAVASREDRWPILVTTADHALLSAATVGAFLAAGDGADVAFGVVERRVVHARFPGNRRTWLRFGDGAWSGANLFLFNGPAALPLIDLWSGIEADRKKGWRLVARFGPWLLVRALTRTIGFADAVRIAGRRIGADVRAVALDDPLAAVDVDKPADLALARAVIEGRA